MDNLNLTKQRERERVVLLDAIKGFCAFAVVVDHAISAAGLRQYYFFDFLYTFVCEFHLPPFFFVSGFLVGRTYRWQGFTCYFMKELKRSINIAFPAIVIVILRYFMHCAAKVPMSLLDSAMGLWFPWVIIAISVLFPLCRQLIKNYWLILAISLAGLFLSTALLPKAGMFFFYFFMYALGASLASFYPEILKMLRPVPALLAFIAAQALAVFSYSRIGCDVVKDPLWRFCCGLLMTYVLAYFFHTYESKFFTSAGRYSLQIYLLHIPFNTWLRPYTESLGLLYQPALCLLLIGLYYWGSVWLCRRFESSRAYRLLFSPCSYIEKLLKQKHTA